MSIILRFFKRRNFLWLFIIALVIFSQQKFMWSNPSLDLHRKAQMISVRIETANNDSEGTGFIVKKEGDFYTVVTAHHVVKYQGYDTPLKLYTFDGKTHTSVSGIRNGNYENGIDLAAFKFRSNNSYPVASFDNPNKSRQNSIVYVAGFPVNSDRSFLLTEGTLSASDRTYADGYSLLYSSRTQPGMSGGAIFNEYGKVIGIHGKGDRITNNNEKIGYNSGISVLRLFEIEENLDIDLRPFTAHKYESTGFQTDLYFADAYRENQSGRYDNALKKYSEVIALKPDFAAAYYNRALIKKYRTNDEAGSIQDFRQAAKLYRQKTLDQELQDAIYQLRDSGATE
jgi:Trypsin-like peptidase domain/TPR repeat